MHDGKTRENSTFKDFQVIREVRQLRILICDDDSSFLETLSRSVERVFRELHIGVELSAFERSAQITEEQLAACDIVFLDIDFVAERQNGIDLCGGWALCLVFARLELGEMLKIVGVCVLYYISARCLFRGEWYQIALLVVLYYLFCGLVIGGIVYGV